MNLNTKVAFIITLILDFFLLLLGAATIVFLKVGGVIVFFIEFLIIRFFHRKIYAFLTSKGTVDESITIKTNDVANAYSNTDVENNLGVEIVKYCDYSGAVHQVRKQKTDSIIKHKRFIYITTTILISSIIIGSLLWNTKPYSNKFSGYLYPICENGLYGYIDSVGNKIIEPHFLWGSTFSNGKAMVVVDTIYKEIDDSISYFIGASDIVQKKYRLLAKYGYIDRSGEFVLSPNYVCFVTVPKGDKVSSIALCDQFFEMHSFRNGRALTYDTITWKLGYINANGETIIPKEYLYAKPFNDSLAVVFKNNSNPITLSNDISIVPSGLRAGYINTNGKQITDCIFETLSKFNSNRGIGKFTQVSKHEDSVNSFIEYNVLIDKNGEFIDTLSFLYKYYDYSDDGIAVAEQIAYFNFDQLGKTSYSFVDRNGKFLEPLKGKSKAYRAFLSKRNDVIQALPADVELADVTYYCDGLAGVTVNNKDWFFVDKNLVIRGYGDQSVYQKTGIFCNGLCAVKKNDLWGYVNNKIEEIIPIKYDSCGIAYPYLEEVFDLSDDGTIEKQYYINRFDSIVWESQNDSNAYNFYSKKAKADWGKWIYDNSNTFASENVYGLMSYVVTVAIILVFCLYISNFIGKLISFRKKYVKICLTLFAFILCIVSSHFIFEYLLLDYTCIAYNNIDKSSNSKRKRSIKSKYIRYEAEGFRSKDSIGVLCKNSDWLKFGIGPLPTGRYISTYVATENDSYFAGNKPVYSYYLKKVPKYKTIDYGYGFREKYQDGWKTEKVPTLYWEPIYYDYSWSYALSSFDISDRFSMFCNEDSVYSKYLKDIANQLTANYGYKYIYTTVDKKKALRYTTYDGIPIKRLIFCANRRAYVMEIKSIDKLGEHAEEACSNIILQNFDLINKGNKTMICSLMGYFIGSILLVFSLLWYNRGEKVINTKAHKLFVLSIFSAIINNVLFYFATYHMFFDFNISMPMAYIQIIGVLSFIFVSCPLIYYYSSVEKKDLSDAWIIPNLIYNNMYSKIKSETYRKLFLTFAIYPLMVLSIIPCGFVLFAYILPVLLISEIIIWVSIWVNWLAISPQKDNIEDSYFIDYYSALNIPYNASQNDINIAYNSKMTFLNQYINNKSFNWDEFDVVQEAYRVLSVPKIKKIYDEEFSSHNNFDDTKKNIINNEELNDYIRKLHNERVGNRNNSPHGTKLFDKIFFFVIILITSIIFISKCTS